MTAIKRFPKFLKDDIVFIIGSFIIVAIPTFFIISGALSLINTTRNGIESFRGYMTSQAMPSMENANGGARYQEDGDSSINEPQYEAGGAMMDIAGRFTVLGTSEKDLAGKSPTPYAAALGFWAVILLIRFIWWVRPKRYYSFREF